MIDSNELFSDAWAFSRLLRTDLDPIEDVRAWLVVVVSRLFRPLLRVGFEKYITCSPAED